MTASPISPKKQNETPTDKASRKTAVATVWIAILTAVICLAGIAQYIVFTDQLSEMKSTSALMKAQLDEMQADKRPWISFDTEVVEPMRFDKDNATISLKINLKNTGNSPAVQILPLPVLMPIKIGESISGIGSISQNCPPKEAMSPKQTGLGYALFHDQTVQPRFSASFPRNKFSEQGQFNLGLIVCVDYLFSSYHGTGRTVNRYWINFHPTMNISTRNDPVPLESIFLMPMGSYAD